MGKIKEWSEPLTSGEIAYIDLQSLMADNVTHKTIEDVLSDFKSLPQVEVVDYFAISETWFSSFIKQELQSLHDEGNGVLDISHHLNEEIKSPSEGSSKLPNSVYEHLERKAEQHLIDALSQMIDHSHHRFRTIVLTDDQYRLEQRNLIERAEGEAASQWQKLKESPDHDIKFTIANISTATPNKAALYEALLKDKSIQKACDEHFWASIASLEAENDSAFTTFWSDRVDSKLNIYAEGLTSITDTKLRDQLSDLLATYIQKDLVPDSIAKARSQGLVLSRKTKKNLSRLEATLLTTKSEVAAITATLEKFAKKQDIPSPPQSDKQVMLSDMLRRMSKPSSSDPILFLYLVVILHAKYHPGIVYATGKYAPKLMKMLKGKLSDEDMQKLEAWKEGAKTGTLGKEGRAEMVGLASEAVKGEGVVKEDGEDDGVNKGE
jgi:hypothetical protein